MPSGFDLIAPAGFAWAVTPSDSASLPMETRGIWVGTTGNVRLDAYDPVTGNLAPVTFTGVPSGTTLRVKTKRIYSTSTTATNIVALA